MKLRTTFLLALAIGSAGAKAAYAAEGTSPQAPNPPHNVILFVPDGLRSHMVREDTAPAMFALARDGVAFANSHSIFPTFTMANASAFATGHVLGDTGVFSNTIYSAFKVPSAGGAVTPFIENDAVLGDMDKHFSADFIDEETLLAAARAKGFKTAAVGKVGPTLLQDHTERSGADTVIIDDATGTAAGIPLAPWVNSALSSLGLPGAAPARGENGKSGSATVPGTKVANVEQQNWFVAAFTRVILPRFHEEKKPFVAVFWSRDPDGSQHNQGDSLNTLEPGINGPTSLAAIRNADTDLAQIREALKAEGLSETTDIIVAADHGFSTISKQSKTSIAAKASYADVPEGFLPPGFVAIDVGAALHAPVLDPNAEYAPLAANQHTKGGNAVIGDSADKPLAVVAANGGSDLIYIPGANAEVARRIVDLLLSEDYVSGLFVDERLGTYAGTLPISAINLSGAAITPVPAIVINFRSGSSMCADRLVCAVEVSDTGLAQGQGMHGSFSRGDTQNFIAAIGPDFKRGFVDLAPVSNADVGTTIASIMGLKIAPHGHLVGRVMTEAEPGGAPVTFEKKTLASEPSAAGLSTLVDTQRVGDTVYFDAAGFAGRTAGLGGQFPAAW
jgi:arylsulfatase A-like enzyme